jgi:hypothetical protein
MKAYSRQPSMKEKKREYMRIWGQQPKAKAKKKEYQNRPEVKARRAITQKAYAEQHKEELQLYHREYNKAYGFEYWGQPKVKARVFLRERPEIDAIRNYPKAETRKELIEQLTEMIIKHRANPICACGCGATKEQLKNYRGRDPWCIDHKGNIIRGMITQHCNIRVLGQYEKLTKERKKQLDDYINGKVLVSV